MDWQNIASHWISWTNVRTNVQFSNQAMFTWLDWKKCQSKKQRKSGKAMIKLDCQNIAFTLLYIALHCF
jgi:hypothetical protein